MSTRKGPKWAYRLLGPLLLTTPLFVSGCGSKMAVLDPAGPVARTELHLMELSVTAMAIVVVTVWILAAIALIRFHDRPGHPGPRTPKWQHSRLLEVVLWGIPLLVVTFIAIPMTQKTYALDRLPPAKDPVIIDVTSLDYKWLFQYPGAGIATVNYIKIPVGEPVLFKLTADSPMNTFWIPRLGGMEFCMPGEVLPLWLEASKPGVYLGRSGQFSGVGFVHMVFKTEAVSPQAFRQWEQQVKRTAPPMTEADYRGLLVENTTGEHTYSSYPPGIFPKKTHGFTLNGTMPMPMPDSGS
ncbi:Quinol oxidase subunit 2 [Candidatus Hydrogenisulfobacillus filiaventi]|uniref:Quinol oxidase subunit 2 n=1 Tax=Candidatus Hydrogenisulfobacillus filiaventi TaxID=2707344 RepID=A0A6F8ZF66_9FIRM|nr:cytochrome c oxidase subunit II [Bacillota bacterium]CAB1128273.1 Quinol oxidase subunit 2 [Candidatus Hydrogenisulfobacillus filiaventi]